jgi:hypothetical protein
MRTRGALIAAALAAGTLAAPAGAAPKPQVVVVTGAAGTMAEVVLRAPVAITDDGKRLHAAASKGGWAGFVVVAAAGDPAKRASMVSVTMTEQFRCPGTTCAWTAGGPPAIADMDSRGRATLPAGRYRVVLAGEAGSTVTATLAPDGAHGRVAVRTSARPLTYRVATSAGTGAAGADAVLHTYEEIPDAGVWSGVAMYAAHAASPAGALFSASCMTAGSDNAASRQVGGTAPCHDLQGEDFTQSPAAGPVADRTHGAYAPVGASAVAVTGRSGDPFGVGYDIAVVAPSSSLRSVFIGVSLS